MKILKTSALSVLLALGFFSANAQKVKLSPVNEPDYSKPKLFSDLPQKIALNTTVLDGLLSAEIGTEVAIPLAGTAKYQGAVISKSAAVDNNTKSIVIKSTNRQGSTLSITRIKNDDGTFSYSGRIISFKNSDAFEMADENGTYVFQKKSLYDLYNE